MIRYRRETLTDLDGIQDATGGQQQEGDEGPMFGASILQELEKFEGNGDEILRQAVVEAIQDLAAEGRLLLASKRRASMW
jgi:hypothetical protein